MNVAVALLGFLPFTRGLALDLLALKTLRFGWQRSIKTLMWMLLTPMVFGFLGHHYFAGFYIALSILPVFGMAMLLGACNRWQTLVEYLWITLVVLWLALRFLVPDPWYGMLFAPFELQWQAYQQWFGQNGMVLSLAEVRRLMPVGISLYLFTNLSHIVVARAVQAWCYQPGGFVKEMRDFSLSGMILVGFSLGVLGVMLSMKDAASILLLSMMPIAALGLVRGCIRLGRLSKKIKLAAPLLVVAFIMGLPMTFYILVLIGIVDILMKFGRFSYASNITRKNS